MQFLQGNDQIQKPSAQPSLTVPYAFVDGSYNPNTGTYGFGGFLVTNKEKYPNEPGSPDNWETAYNSDVQKALREKLKVENEK